jgi:hypothetical protein
MMGVTLRCAAWTMLVLSIVASRGVARAEDANTAKAKEHFQTGSRQFALGRFDEAIKEYEAAYELRDDPVFLYNIAQAHRLNRNPEKALFFYRSYLSHAGNPPNAGDVQKKIAELQALIEQQSRTQAAPPQGPISPEPRTTSPPAQTPANSTPASPSTATPAPTEPGATSAAAAPPASEHAGRAKVIAGGAMIGGGVALLATGIAFSVVAVDAGNSVKSAASSGGVYDPAAQDRAKTMQIVGPVLDGVGVAAAAGGVVLLLLGRRDARAHAAVVPVGGRGFAGLTYQTEF